MARKIVVSANKGGVLKTSIAVNLAGLLSRKGRVLIIDMDMQGNVAVSFGKNPDAIENTLYDVMVDGLPADRAIMKVHKNIDILPTNEDMQYIDFDILTNVKNYDNIMYLLKNEIDHMEHNYDYIIVDTPPYLGLIHQNALMLADEVLVPFQPENFSMRSLIAILKSIKKFKLEKKPDLQILGIIGTLIDGRITLHSDIMNQARKLADKNGIHMFKSVIPRKIEYSKSFAYKKKPLTLTRKYKSLASHYQDLLEEIENGTKQKQR